MILLWLPSTSRLERILRRARGTGFTYPEVGATRTGTTPPRSHGVRATGRLGSGDGTFAAASDAVLGWQVQRGAGLGVLAETPRAEPGTVLLCTMPVGPLRVVIPCRVVYVLDEPDRTGFAYGTLPGHPESGEEAFVVERHGDGSVWLSITAFSRPAGLLERLTQPVSRILQEQVTQRYISGMQRFLVSAGHG